MKKKSDMISGLVPDVGDRHLVPHVQHQTLDGVGEPRGGILARPLLPELVPGNPHGQEDQERRDEQENDMLGGREVQGQRAEVNVRPFFPME
jgi:hypothetical protein